MSRYYRSETYTDHGGRQVTRDIVNGVPIMRDVGLCLLALIALGMAGCPVYNVWSAGLQGQAELRRAEQNRQIAIQEARAKKESATLLADAEVERAKGIAAANKIVADGLKGHEEYLRYLWIDKVAGSAQREVIYVPTEASLPILEARTPADKSK